HRTPLFQQTHNAVGRCFGEKSGLGRSLAPPPCQMLVWSLPHRVDRGSLPNNSMALDNKIQRIHGFMLEFVPPLAQLPDGYALGYLHYGLPDFLHYAPNSTS